MNSTSGYKFYCIPPNDEVNSIINASRMLYRKLKELSRKNEMNNNNNNNDNDNDNNVH